MLPVTSAFPVECYQGEHAVTTEWGFTLLGPGANWPESERLVSSGFLPGDAEPLPTLP